MVVLRIRYICILVLVASADYARYHEYNRILGIDNHR